MRIEICGPLGSGKTTLARALADVSGFALVTEPVETHPFLEAFYKDKAHAFENAAFFITDYIHQSKKHAGTGAIFDAGAALHKTYAAIATLTKEEGAALASLYAIADLSPPDLIIHLDYTPAEIMARVKKRGRAFESGISEAFIGTLSAGISKQLASRPNDTPVLTLRSGEYDFIANPKDAEKLWQRITDALQLAAGSGPAAPKA